MKFNVLILVAALILATNSQATLITVATDNADNYGDQWLGNGGTGFDSWDFITNNAEGSAGGFLANQANESDLNYIASSPSNNAWGSWANGGGFNQFEAYRGFANHELNSTGDSFSVSIEHGNITNGGSAGFVLRNGNVHNNIGDYNNQMRFEFGFIGGGNHYSIFDGYGTTETGINFSHSGLNLTFTLLGNDLYQLDIYAADSDAFLHSSNGLLSGVGAINSVALYNRNSEEANAYFNNLAIRQQINVTVAEPTTHLMLLSALLLLFTRREKTLP